MTLTGRPDGPALGPPDGLIPRLDHVADAIRSLSSQVGAGVDLDPVPLLSERASLAGFVRRGTTSCGGATRLLRGTDGWLAVTLARPEDVELLPAWLRCPVNDDPWATVVTQVGAHPVAGLEARGAELGLPVAVLAQPPSPATETQGRLPVRTHRLGRAAATTDLSSVVVADLSSLWAGPLCGSVLARAGATVWKVESTSRPDGGRAGPPAFFDLMNGGKHSVEIDLATEEGRTTLGRIVAAADVVIEASRPRALAQLGIDRHALVQAGRPRVWVAITAHGLDGPGGNRAGFGDDVAIAGGLAAYDADGPVFCSDAIADPLSGLVAAAAALEALVVGGRWLIDVNMRRVAATFAGSTLPVPSGLSALVPQPRTATAVAAPLGTHTAEVLRHVDARLGAR